MYFFISIVDIRSFQNGYFPSRIIGNAFVIILQRASGDIQIINWFQLKMSIATSLFIW